MSQQIAAVTRRRAQIVWGNLAIRIVALWYASKSRHILSEFDGFRSSFIFQGLIVGSVFYNMPETTGAFFSRGGDLF
jgi:ATP-binding cassette subfamily G (WHITE) protein 2 (SNQ2)